MTSQTTVRLDDDLQEHIEEYMEQSRFEIEKSSIIRTALREFFVREAKCGEYNDEGLPELKVDLKDCSDESATG